MAISNDDLAKPLFTPTTMSLETITGDTQTTKPKIRKHNVSSRKSSDIIRSD